MDQPTGSSSETATTASNPHVVSKLTVNPNEEQQPQTGSAPKEKGHPEKSYPEQGYWQKLKEEKPDRHIELFLTFAITFFAAVQWITSCTSNESNGRQTDQLIAAAKVSAYAAQQNQQASRNFADSARGINEGVDDAVRRLEKQATAVELARETADANARTLLQETASQFREDQRPYILLTRSHLEGERTISAQQLILWRVEYANYGRTPATHFSSLGRVFFGSNAKKDAYAYMSNMPIDRLLIAGPGSEGILAPHVPSDGISYATLNSQTVPNNDDIAYISSHEFALFAVGRFFYNDLYGTAHYTDYCRFQLLTGAIGECDQFNDLH